MKKQIYSLDKLCQVSYSGSQTLEDCERAFCHKYLAQTPADADYETPDYFTFGQCVHKFLELTKHDYHEFSKINFDAIIKSYAGLNPIEDGAKIAAMLRRYWKLHIASKLQTVACETWFNGTYTRGVIDAVMVESAGDGWWIVDLKTTGMAEASLSARIKRDPQLNLYAAFRNELAHELKLNPGKFCGIRYREMLKPRVVYKKGESFGDYTARCENGATCREIVVPAADINSKEAFDEFNKLVSRAHELQREMLAKQELVGRCNFKNCLKWNRPCQYFSQCYGKSYTESVDKALVWTDENIAERMAVLMKPEDNLPDDSEFV